MSDAHDLWSTPRLFPHRLDPLFDRVVMVERSEADLRAASFLDDRSLGPQARPVAVDWAEVGRDVPADVRRDVQYIFHIGHVGSTLIARLLGERPDVLSLREPLLLRGVADQLARLGAADCAWAPESASARLDAFTALISRTFRPGQRALVKATSFTSEVASQLVPPGSAALFLWVPPERYLASIMAGDASRQEAHLLAAARLSRMNRRLGDDRHRLWEMGEAERVALGWACEMTSLRRAAALMPGPIRWMDFDRFLDDPAGQLLEVATLFGIRLTRPEAAELASGPLMSRYSKAPEHGYSAALRRQVMAEARRAHAPAIARGLAWLERAADGDPLLAECLAFAAQGS